MMSVVGIAGSIPACAGEPATDDAPNLPSMVYPRVCGGTVVTGVALGVFGGLSPRVRGNHEHGRMEGMTQWSIPACAGEPA